MKPNLKDIPAVIIISLWAAFTLFAMFKSGMFIPVSLVFACMLALVWAIERLF